MYEGMTYNGVVHGSALAIRRVRVGARLSPDLGISALPFKLNQDRRHHIPRQQHGHQLARLRGRLASAWQLDRVVYRRSGRGVGGGATHNPRRSTLLFAAGDPDGADLARGVPPRLSPAEGLIGSIINLLGLTLRVPDHTTLSRRSSTLAVPRPQLNNTGDADNAQPLHLLVDSTGLKLCGAGEWLVEKHGTRRRRAWRKLHLGVDAGTGQIVAAALTGKEVDDAVQIGPLLDQLTGSLASVIADGAYDQDGVYADVAERHPDATVIVPPRCTAVLSEQSATEPTQRDRTSSVSMREVAWAGSKRPATTSAPELRRRSDDGNR